MLKEKIENVHHALGGLMHEVSSEQADVLRQCRNILEAVGEMADALETNLLVPMDTPVPCSTLVDRPALPGEVRRCA